MTAINVLAHKRHNVIQIVTDGAMYDSSGVLRDVGSKVDLIPEWNAAIMGRGGRREINTAVRYLRACFISFDELIYRVSDELRHIVEVQRLERPFELVMTGFSTDRARPEIYWIRTDGHDSSGAGRLPFVAWPMGREFFCPWPSDDLIAASGFVPPSADDAPPKSARGLRELIDLQRQTPLEFCCVGSFVELTVLMPGSSDSMIVHNWEDRIGEKITPNREFF